MKKRGEFGSVTSITISLDDIGKEGEIVVNYRFSTIESYGESSINCISSME